LVSFVFESEAKRGRNVEVNPNVRFHVQRHATNWPAPYGPMLLPMQSFPFLLFMA